MKYYFKQFIKENYSSKSDGYLFILWAVIKNIGKENRLHQSIKKELEKLDIDNFNFDKKKEISSRIVNRMKASPEKASGKDYSGLKSIQIKNFKGFGELSEQDRGTYIALNANKNIFFAPNGGGKTSFCEAFEYALTGDVKEAKRRGVNKKDYITRNGKKEEISLQFIDSQLELKKLDEHDKQFFQQCFIEKNRLQEFSLLGSKDTGVKEKDVIAILLGLTDLDELISSFAQSTSFNVLRNDIQDKIKQLESDNKTNVSLLKEYSEDLLNLKKEVFKYLEEGEEVTTETINEKADKNKEKIKEYEERIKKLSENQLPELNMETLRREIVDFKSKVNEYHELQKSLQEQVEKLNLENFYSVLLEIKDISNGKCPACDTDLENVTKNPFNKAAAELEDLKEIKRVKSKFVVLENNLLDQWYSWCIDVIKNYQTCIQCYTELSNEAFNDTINVLRNKIRDHSKQSKLKFIETFKDELEIKQSELKQFNEIYTETSKKHKNVQNEVDKLQREIKGIRDKNQVLNTIKVQITSLEEKMDKVNKENEKYEKKVEKLERLKVKETKYNSLVTDVQKAYKEFYQDLLLFKVNVEKKQIDQIGDRVLKYYQYINKNDDPSEYITKIRFVLQDNNYRIQLTLNDSNIEKDAYACLSEGHLRSLGLSIMLAVAEKNNVPFLIFDDVVNAIDSDHRANILEMIFNDKFIKKTQMIITTHDRLFWERFCNLYKRYLAKKKNEDFQISNIFSYTNKGTILMQHNVGFEDKILKALEQYDIRQALIYCRIWFETLATEYCVDKEHKITGKFSKGVPSNLLKPTLESIYDVLVDNLGSNSCIQKIRKDLINWRGQNQEHHAFEENSYNFVHSKTSDEVKIVFEAVRDLADLLFTEKQIDYVESSIQELERVFRSLEAKLNNSGFITNAPITDIEEAKEQKLKAEKSLDYYETRRGKLKMFTVQQ
ncbi:hypothetical protein BKP35_05495 [Anaerobacillus arseniciselenatis]|uniref:Nuclease SbcCD subunit C n=1 Tax=Anaerobacillus arseniciselenatis TaxID=85682 RepID=A0A1S2LQU5_9BACI|nr:hypothetical protein [Anaerobacillus arseniciselenatis]OIJ14889.1 hypothetical protein BKP35_05495 [Anaerobacillus arseniciselenatis]